jgi:hypothetical protein
MRFSGAIGILYANFLYVDDSEFGGGRQVGDREFVQDENGASTSHGYSEDDEPNQYISDFEILLKRKRAIEIGPFATATTENKAAVFLDYIAQKKHSEEN